MAEVVLAVLRLLGLGLPVLAGMRKMNHRYAHAADVSIRCRPKGAHVRATKQLPNAVMRPNRIRCKRGAAAAEGQTKATHGDIPNVAPTHTYILPWKEMVINAFNLRELRGMKHESAD